MIYVRTEAPLCIHTKRSGVGFMCGMGEPVALGRAD